MSNFYKYFKANMDGLGLPAPETLFGTLQTTVANASVLLGLIDKFGKSVTIGELVGAGTKLEGLAVVSGCAAAFYVGAVIGSLAVATGRSMTEDLSLSDVLHVANRYGLSRPWLMMNLQRWPALYTPKLASRSMSQRYAAMV